MNNAIYREFVYFVANNKIVGKVVMKTGKTIFTIVVMVALLSTPLVITAQTSGKQASAKAPSVQRLYFDHRGHVDAVEADTLVINDRTYKVLSTVTLLSLDQKPLASLNKLKSGDFIGFTVDDKRRIDAIYLLSPPKIKKQKK